MHTGIRAVGDAYLSDYIKHAFILWGKLSVINLEYVTVITENSRNMVLHKAMQCRRTATSWPMLVTMSIDLSPKAKIYHRHGRLYKSVNHSG
jgi:hypothetical protein